MSTLWIEEEQGIPVGAGGTIPVHDATGTTVQQQITLSGSSQQSSAFNAATEFVTLHADAACYVTFGTNPTATTSKVHLIANQYKTFKVKQGSSWKVAVIT